MALETALKQSVESQSEAASLPSNALPTDHSHMPQAVPSSLLGDTKPSAVISISEAAKEIQEILKVGTTEPLPRFTDVVPHLNKLFKSFDPDDPSTPVALADIWYAKGGANVQAFRYLGYFAENEPLAEKVIESLGAEKFKLELKALYDKLPTQEEAFSEKDRIKAFTQLKIYLPTPSSQKE